MRVLFRITLTLLLALPMLLVVTIFWALQGGRDASPNPERPGSISDERELSRESRASSIGESRSREHS
jgi:hypothetical protein